LQFKAGALKLEAKAEAKAARYNAWHAPLDSRTTLLCHVLLVVGELDRRGFVDGLGLI